MALVRGGLRTVKHRNETVGNKLSKRGLSPLKFARNASKKTMKQQQYPTGRVTTPLPTRYETPTPTRT